MRLTRQRRFFALLLLAVWLPFYSHCALEAHCPGVCAPVEHAEHDEPCGGECPHGDPEHCHDHDVVPVLAKNVVPMLLAVEFPAWLVAALVVPSLEQESVIADARAPDELPPPHLIFAVAALPVRGPSLA